MNGRQRSQAVFGAFDGTVSIVGFVFGLLQHGSPKAAIVIGGIGGMVSATISMGTGAFESCEGQWRERLTQALSMALATVLGSLVPLWPFLVLSRRPAVLVAALGCLVVAGWIGWEKRKGARGFVEAYATMLGAAALSLGVVALIPGSVGG